MKLKLAKTKQAANYPAEVEGIRREVERVAGLLGLVDNWTFKLTFKQIGESTMGETSVEWHYRIAEFDFDIQAMLEAELSDEEVRQVIRHEMIHVVLWRVMELVASVAPAHEELIGKYEEELATTFELMPFWNRL